ncbi:hypothetical protein EYF80_012268 [Liparis tanakae]|uniref:Uncharacterized protein n=1 Tax=Liparis tanakae TaxID=230148 RepID=A0A4Z2IJ39_9TELE|nr:hypothetical protein EYF80_012268 [Liparis tanakae]
MATGLRDNEYTRLTWRYLDIGWELCGGSLWQPGGHSDRLCTRCPWYGYHHCPSWGCGLDFGGHLAQGWFCALRLPASGHASWGGHLCYHHERGSLTPCDCNCRGGGLVEMSNWDDFRVELAAAAEREADDVRGVLLPAGVQGIGYGVSGLRKNLLDHGPVGAHADPLTELGGHMNHNTLTLQRPPTAFLLRPPALQLSLQRSQLKETSLFVQQGVLESLAARDNICILVPNRFLPIALFSYHVTSLAQQWSRGRWKNALQSGFRFDT